MSDSLETIKERLARQGQGQTPFTPPGAEKTAAPAPSPAPAAQDVPPQVDPDIAKTLASEKKAVEDRAAALEAELARTKADFDALLKTQLDAVKLPSKEDLGRMEQGEALEMVLKATKAMVGEGIRGVVTDLNRNALVPIQKQLADTVIAQKREIAEEVYGSEVMRKYRPQFEDRCRRYPRFRRATC